MIRIQRSHLSLLYGFILLAAFTMVPFAAHAENQDSCTGMGGTYYSDTGACVMPSGGSGGGADYSWYNPQPSTCTVNTTSATVGSVVTYTNSVQHATNWAVSQPDGSWTTTTSYADDETFSHVYTTTGTYNVFAATNDAQYLGTCPMVTVSAAPVVPTATLAASPAVVSSGGSSTLTWSSTDATSCTGTNFSTAGATSGSVSVSPTSDTTYRVDCSGTGGNAWDSRAVTIGTGRPDLTVADGASVSATQGVPVTLSQTISNNGTASTGGSFYNFIRVCSAYCSPYDQSAEASTVALAAGASRAVSFPWTFTAPGTYYYALCTDLRSGYTGGVIDESDENNNCSNWQYVVVSAVAQPDLTAGATTVTNSIAGQTTSFSGSVSNIGTGTAGSSLAYFSIASVSNAWSGATGSIAPGASAAVASSYVLTTPGTYTVTLCADGAGAVSETNEGNNCGAPTTFTLYAVPTATITLTPSAVASGGASTLSWSSTAATTCTGTNFATANATSGSVSVSPSTSTVYTLSCTGAGGNATDTKTLTIGSAALPDLTAGAVSPTSARAGSSATFSATISNTGGASTGGAFTNLLQKADDASGGGASDIATKSVSTIGANSSSVAAYTYTFPVSDAGTTKYLRACADKNAATGVGDIDEGIETNNCGAWTAITVGTASPAALSCTPSPASTDPNQNVSWRADPSGFVAGTPITYTWTAMGGAPSSGSATEATGSGNAFVTQYPTGGSYSASVTATQGSLTAGPQSCTPVTISGPVNSCSGAITPTIYISHNRSRVNIGDSVLLTYGATGMPSGSCVVTGPASFTPITTAAADPATCTIPIAGTQTGAITAQSTYTMTCGTAKASIIVNIIPKFIEF
ncbi:MAG: hypothetical protein JWL82_336 [Parcubacteria group bacterium]|nr:hypothetical protein [Parcubacteria group bacterium]